jgi:hypothetical protein
MKPAAVYARTPVCRPPKNLIGCRNGHLVYLCDRMRKDEIVQYEALTGCKFNPEVASTGFINLPGIKYTVVGANNYPAASGGYHEIIPGVWQSWMVGTEEGWKTNWRSITKATRWLIDGLFEMGARRLQTTALASRTEAITWYVAALGLHYEGCHRAFGANGEDVYAFARVAGD